MALNTRDERASACLVTLPWRGLLPAPDRSGANTAPQRQMVAFMYAGDQEVEVEVVAAPAVAPAFRQPVYSHVFVRPDPAVLDFQSLGGGLFYGGSAGVKYPVRALSHVSRGSVAVGGRGLRSVRACRVTSRSSLSVSGAARVQLGVSHRSRGPLSYAARSRVVAVDVERVRADDAALKRVLDLAGESEAAAMLGAGV